ncbi:hypothetical protein ACSV9I_19085 [Rhizobium sp. G187]|uniref:hypothetical protein n=1 Tax=unclassified Rhizobium TaxID=2613769 RepID=UPI0006B90AE5|nr:hypothetical protein [Rhizobium sp. AAP43]KPF43417.1 hypothetical protein IP76_13740 [Rhizobium sp. AAP43]
MQIIGTEVTETSGTATIVEFRGDGGERIAVTMAQGEDRLASEDAVAKAQVMLLQAASFGTSADPTNTESSDAVDSLRQEQADQDSRKSDLQEGLEDTFPASDPVSATYTSTPGSDQRH